MKASPRDISGHLKTLDPKFRAVLIFGKDSGRIRESRNQITKQIIPEDGDPFCLATITPEQVKEDPAIIADEMGAVSMMGGRRLVRLDEATDKDLEAIQNGLSMETGDTLLLVTSGDLAPRSKLRSYFEKENGVLAIACYADDARDLAALIAEEFRSHNIQAAPDVIGYLKNHLGRDRIVTRSELEKIIFFLGAQKGDIGPEKILTFDDAKSLTSDSADMAVADIAAEALRGNSKRLVGLLDKARVEGAGAIEILRILQFQLHRLGLVRGMMDEGRSMDDALKSLRPPVFFKDRDAFVGQVRSWPKPRLTAALDYVVRAEAACKKTGAPDFSIAAKTCMDICQQAKRQ
jgi:DNA polymerase-3 subunit delta